MDTLTLLAFTQGALAAIIFYDMVSRQSCLRSLRQEKERLTEAHQKLSELHNNSAAMLASVKSRIDLVDKIQTPQPKSFMGGR